MSMGFIIGLVSLYVIGLIKLEKYYKEKKNGTPSN